MSCATSLTVAGKKLLNRRALWDTDAHRPTMSQVRAQNNHSVFISIAIY